MINSDYKVHEKIAVLEERVQNLDETNEKIYKILKEVQGDLNRYKGFIGAIAFIISCVGIFFSGWKFFRG